MSKVTIKLNSAGVRALLHDGGIVGMCGEVASSIAASAGEGYEVSQHSYPERGAYSVRTTTFETARRERKENYLQNLTVGRGGKSK